MKSEQETLTPDSYELNIKGTRQPIKLTSGVGPKTTGKELRTMISEKIGEDPQSESLWIYCRHIKIDSGNDSQTLEQLGIKDNANIHVAYRTKGGSQWALKISTFDDQTINVSVNQSDSVVKLKKAIYQKYKKLPAENMALEFQNKIPLSQIPGIRVTTNPKDVDIISHYDDVNIERALLPCGHAICSESMLMHLQFQVKQGNNQIKCCGLKNQKCGAIIPYELCAKIAVMTVEENNQLEDGLFANNINSSKEFKTCPFCNVKVIVTNRLAREKKIICNACRKAGKSYPYFCWVCEKPWKNLKDDNNCGNIDCSSVDTINEILQSCGKTKVYQIEVPETRACPSCRTLISHVDKCKHMDCKGCNAKFCFICLKLQDEKHQWRCGSYNTPCEPAPRQHFNE